MQRCPDRRVFGLPEVWPTGREGRGLTKRSRQKEARLPFYYITLWFHRFPRRRLDKAPHIDYPLGDGPKPPVSQSYTRAVHSTFGATL